VKLSPKLSVDQFSADQLVLNVSETVDPDRLQLSDYDDFLAEVSVGRPYHRQAVEATIRYLCGGRYANTADLARESYESSADLQRRYASAEKLIEELRFPNILACSLDLATATGKSFVYHSIARICLNEGLVNRVLILCPSLTIEEGLKEKLSELVADSDLADLLPIRPGGIVIPEIVDAASTVREGQICIENIHATYERTSASIQDSFQGQGENTLVISDEAHHIYSPKGAGLKKWEKFLNDREYGFGYHVGGSGTCWIKNDYFSDVIYRYPIRQAIDDRWIKEVYYLDKDDSSTNEERFQKLRAQHEKNRKTYKPLKPLTIAITESITAAEKLGGALVDFVAEQGNGGRVAAEAKVLVVTSDEKHEKNVLALKAVDSTSSPVEWIVSVSMLSEGWDVQNVFQIYPHEKRAFNSKLLISQVLGRGLRQPPSLNQQALVYVFNHEKWGPEVEELVAEVLDVETTIAQHPAKRDAAPHFELHNLAFEEVPTGIKGQKVEKPAPIKQIDLAAQRDRRETTTFVSATDKTRTDVLTTQVVEKRYPVAEVVKEVRARLLQHDQETNGSLAKDYPKKRVENLVTGGLKRLKDKSGQVTQENRQRILSAFGSRRQKMTKPGAELKREPIGLSTTSTEEMRPSVHRISGLTSTLGLYYDSESEKLGTPDDAAALKKALEISVPTLMSPVLNSFFFKSPTNIVLTSHQPEYSFVARLVAEETAKKLRGWVKSPDSGFYTIEFSYKQTPDSKRKPSDFNPDFFLLLEDKDEVIVVETKADIDITPINAGKLVAAQEHFKVVNDLLKKNRKKRRYQFHILGPADYDGFFDALRAGELDGYTSSLQAALSIEPESEGV
jgi:type III restriction enzyme